MNSVDLQESPTDVRILAAALADVRQRHADAVARTDHRHQAMVRRMARRVWR